MKNKLIDEIKKAYTNNDASEYERKLFILILEYNGDIRAGEPYDHTLKHVLFRNNLIRNPLGVKYTVDNYTNTMHILQKTMFLCKAINEHKINMDNVFHEGFAIDNRIINDIIDIAIYTECLHKMNLINTQRMDDNAISKIPLVEQLLNVVLFYQDQLRIAKQNYQKELCENIITGMELLVADKSVEYCKDASVSMSDSFESMLESIDEIVRYLYYKHGKTLKESISTSDVDFRMINPYENGEFEKYLYVAAQRYLLCRLEEGIRYGYYSWNGLNKTEEGQRVYIFELENDEKYTARKLGIYRREYQIRKCSVIGYPNSDRIIAADEVMSKLTDELIATQEKCCLMFDLSDFHPNLEEFRMAEEFSGIKEHIVQALTKEYYLEQTVSDMKICDLLKTYKYLDVLGEIVSRASIKLIDENNQETYIKELCIVNISYLAKELSRFHGFKIEYSEKLIKQFVFSEKPNKEDIFSQPLLKISKTQVIFSPALIDQVNLDRFIERQFLHYNKNISNVGILFEKNFINTLEKGYSTNVFDLDRKTIPNLKINKNKIEYVAFDGKDIEFDVLMVLDDYLILTELKAVMTSYELSELENRKRNVKTAINQLQRRSESVKYDWEKIRAMSSIELPEEPFDKEHIILVACTDAFDFTPIKEQDVYITDDSTFLKYFTNPHVETIELSEGCAMIKTFKKLWAKDRPDAEEFKEYLLDPVTIHPFIDYMEKQFIPLPVMDENDLAIVCKEYRLIKDPIKEQAL